ncbi:hypothetical protein JCGZ_21853 [Jatropha curcas]|uniref:UEV domain-containing protein n=2 Tax=Jatropha curcas TaxID=180498 RepID=A0A067JC46_JATCU|nr:hypothetical protein JCGZ_21853 [Jatropha curcas]
MASSSSINFIETALSCTTTNSLSYPDPKQKWLIRKHLLSLIQNYPTFRPSINTFTHNDGTTANLLHVAGNLHISNYIPPVPLTIWLHESYPYMPPLVFVSSSNSMSPIHKNHPFVDSSSGFTSSPYLQTWNFPRCNLTCLVRNIINIFNIDHPLIHNSFSCVSLTNPLLVSKMEALDRLSGMIHYDMIDLMAKNQEEMQELCKLSAELMKRGDILRNTIIDLEEKKLMLKDRVMKLMEEGDVLMNWLRVNDLKSIVAIGGEDDAFEGVDYESKMVIDCLSADRCIEDLIYELDKAVEEGVMPFDSYIKQVRILAREQFSYRATLVNRGEAKI